MSDFRKAIEWVLGNEGGFSDHESDPGKATNWGVTAATARRHGFDDPRDLEREDAIQIYREEYWLPRMGEVVVQPIANKILDLNVHFGPKNGVRIAQEALNSLKTGWVDIDGWMGNNTVRALNMLQDGRTEPPNYQSVYWWVRAASAHQSLRYAQQMLGNLKKLDFFYGWNARAGRRP